jgi:uncharacterized protein YkwD
VINNFVRFPVHHQPQGPSFSARLTGALTRASLHARHALRRRSARLGLGVLVCALITSAVLAVPVVSGADDRRSSAAPDPSSSSAPRTSDSPVVMGLDGGAVSSSTFTGPIPSGPGTPSATPETTQPAPADVPPVPDEPAPAPAAGAPAAPEPEDAGTPPVAAAAPPAPQAAPAPAPAPAPGVAAEMLALVNAARAGAGCAPLLADSGLAAVAQAHSADMRDRDFFDHVNPDGLDPFERAEQAGQTSSRAENIASGQETAAEAMADWMDSSGHRDNILDCELRTLGIGLAEGPGGPWWTQLFGD